MTKCYKSAKTNKKLCYAFAKKEAVNTRQPLF